VALTKIDMVDEEWLELVTDDVEQFAAGTFLEGAPIVPVSSLTGDGIENFVATLDEISKAVPPRSSSGIFRLPVDRVFSMKGFGTVITGTLISGKVQVGDGILVYPTGLTSKVRGIQVHNQSTETAEVGMRTAINFQGLDRSAVNRGDVLAHAGELRPSYMVDVQFHYLASNKKRLKNRTRIRFHSGTSEILGLVCLLDADEIDPGTRTVAQIRLDAPVALVRDDRFVARSYSPVFTIGGGKVLNPVPVKHKRFRSDIVEGLANLVDTDVEGIIVHHVAASGYRGVSFGDLKLMANRNEKQLAQDLQQLLSKRVILQADRENRIYIHGETFERLKVETIGLLEGFHQKNPLKQGMSKEELKSRLPPLVGAKLFNLLMNQMGKDGAVVQEEDLVRLTGHKVSLAHDQADLRRKFLDAYTEGGLTPPYFRELVRAVDIDPAAAKDVLQLLIDEGHILRTKDDLYFHKSAIGDLEQRLVAFLEENGEITTPQFKEMTGASRKFVIPLLEFFDARNVTIRIGDSRKLRKTGTKQG
jgi:selenocysteine-specific elongation factor